VEVKQNKMYFIKPDVRRGDVYYGDLSDGLGSEQQGKRPVLVLQNDIGNHHSVLTIVAPITTQKNDGKMPTHVELSSERYPLLKKGSKVLLEQIRAIDMRRLGAQIITHIFSDDMSLITEKLALSLGLGNCAYRSNTYKRGEIYIADLGYGVGKEERGKTLVAIVQNDIGNEKSPTLIVVPITEKKSFPTLPTHVLIKKRTGMRKNGVLLAEQIRTIDKMRVYGKVGKLTEDEIKQMNRALEVSMQLNPPIVEVSPTKNFKYRIPYDYPPKYNTIINKNEKQIIDR
jgi:mRNA interferase MazF